MWYVYYATPTRFSQHTTTYKQYRKYPEHTNIDMCIHVYIYRHVYTYMHTYIHTYIHGCAPAGLSPAPPSPPVVHMLPHVVYGVYVEC